MGSKLPHRRVLGPPAVGLLALALGLCAGEAKAVDYDWCAPVVVRPDQRIADPVACTPIWTDAEIGYAAEAVLVGDLTDVSHPVILAPGRICYPQPSHAANQPYVARLKATRASSGLSTPLTIVHMARFELVSATFAALAPFNANFLLPTDRPWSEVTGFFSNDTSAACQPGGCSWSDSWSGIPALDPPPRRLRDFIDASGGANRYQGVVQYLSRPVDPKVHWPSSAIADLRNPAYRAWRVAEAKEALRVGGYDAVDLNHKIPQYLSTQWIGSNLAPNVAAVNAGGDTYWTAPPRSYGYSAYIQGWNQLARDLKAAAVPYSLIITWRAWAGNSYEDPSTPTLSEADLIREAMRGAKLVLLDRTAAQAATAEYQTAVNEIAAYGPKIIGFDQACGYGREPVTAPGKPLLKP